MCNVFHFLFNLSLTRPHQHLDTLESVLLEVNSIQAYLPNYLQLQDSVSRAKEWLQEAQSLQVTCSCSIHSLHLFNFKIIIIFIIIIFILINWYVFVCLQLGGHIPVLSSLNDLLIKAKGIPVLLEPLVRLESLVMEVQGWKESAEKLFLVKHSSLSLLEVNKMSHTFSNQ